jgi:uncharacterized RDD family membrane protein YckC
MSCPLCGERCTCSYAGATSSLIDPDEYDISEERFAASLEDERQPGKTAREQRAEQEWQLQAAVGGGCAASVAGGQMLGVEAARSQTQEGHSGMEDGAIWRQEVATRVESYRARRRRPIRERSLPLDFERAVNREITNGSLSGSLDEDEYGTTVQSRGASPEPEPPEEYFAEPPERHESEEPQESKIIEFPRQAMLPVMPPSIEELADPIIDRPRILDVSEEVETASPLSDIDVAPEENQRSAVEFELPLQVAPMSQRVFAGLMDGLIVLAGAAVFVMITLKAGVPMPQAKADFLLALAAPCLFWAIYEYMFLVYAGTTPGMQLAHLELITFDGYGARRRVRRGRAIALVLSSLSLGLGLVWALLDEDTLCWHDRITRTYVVSSNA